MYPGEIVHKIAPRNLATRHKFALFIHANWCKIAIIPYSGKIWQALNLANIGLYINLASFKLGDITPVVDLGWFLYRVPWNPTLGGSTIDDRLI